MSFTEFGIEVKNVLETELFRIGDRPVNVATLALVMIVVFITFFTSRVVRAAISRALLHRGGSEGSVAAVNGLVHYLILFVGLGIALHTLGLNLAALFTAGAVLAIGIGFAMQNIAQNFVSGIILLGERAIKPGDVLALHDKVVKVKRLGIRSAQVFTRDGEDMIVPNSELVQGTVTNFTLREAAYRVWVDVGVVYGSDMRLVAETLARAAEEFTPRLRDRTPQVLMKGFGESSVDFQVGVWIADAWEQRPIRSQLTEAVWDALKEKGITIAFPQLDVHFDPPVHDGLSQLSERAA